MGFVGVAEVVLVVVMVVAVGYPRTGDKRC